MLLVTRNTLCLAIMAAYSTSDIKLEIDNLGNMLDTRGSRPGSTPELLEGMRSNMVAGISAKIHGLRDCSSAEATSIYAAVSSSTLCVTSQAELSAAVDRRVCQLAPQLNGITRSLRATPT